MGVTSLDRRAVYNPRPVVEVDGQRFDKVDALLLTLDMREQEGGLSSVELRFSNRASDANGGAGHAFEDEAEIKLGSTIKVSTGDSSDSREIFRGVITGLEVEFASDQPPELLVLAEDRLQQARMARRTRVFRDKSVVDIATDIAQRLNLQPQVSGLSGSSGTWVQLNESDLAFLRRLVRLFDADLQIDQDRLEVAPISEIQRQVIELALFHDLRSVRFVADLSNQVTEVTSAGWNAVSGQAVSGTSQGSHFGPGQGRRGAAILAQTLGSRSEHIGHIAVITDSEAQALADTVFDQRARGFVRAEGSATGHPSIRVGSHLQLRGMSARFENTYYVVSTHHRYNLATGYVTDFKAESATLGYAA